MWLIQFGGLGLMTMATMVAMVLGKQVTFRERLIIQEAFNQFSLEGMVRLARYVVLATFTIQGVAAIILFFRFQPQFGTTRGMWYAVFHSVSAFCNAGFDLFGNFRSLETFTSDITVNVVMMFLIISGGLGFSVLADLYTRRSPRGLTLHSGLVLKVTALLIVIPAVVIGVLEWNGALAGYDVTGRVLGSLFTAVTPRTAGFNTVPTGQLSYATALLVMMLMFIGASPASTGGGIKTTTFALVALTVVAAVKGQGDVVIRGRRIAQTVTIKCLAIAAISLALVMTTTFVLLVTEDASFLDTVFEAISAFGTVGLSRGITPTLSTIGRLALVITMFAGRVGPLTLVLAIVAKSDPCAASVRYPEGKVIVG